MKYMKKAFIVLAIILAGFSGGWMAQIWGYPLEAFAGRDTAIHASRIYIQDPSGQGKAVLWGNPNGGGLMELLGPDGKTRIQLGSYDGSYAKSEKGLPLIGFSIIVESCTCFSGWLAGMNLPSWYLRTITTGTA